jgi:uncharacterized protein (DUF1330 family)
LAASFFSGPPLAPFEFCDEPFCRRNIILPLYAAVVLCPCRIYRQVQWEDRVKTKYTVALSLLSGVAIGAIAMQGLHAQGAKLKAWSVGELEPVAGATISASYLKDARDAIAKAHGTPLRTVNGRVVSIEGKAPPKVAIVEWPSVDDAVNFYKSEAWTKLAPEREKAQKTIRRYIVESEP